MKSFKQIIKDMTTLSPLMQDREKIETSDIKKFYPNGIHIKAVDAMTDGDGKRFYVYIFAEEDKTFAFSGEVMNKIIDAWVKECDGSLDEVNKILSEEPIGVILGDAINKNKQKYTTVSLINE